MAVFDVAVSRIDVEFPWYYFASGLRVRFERTLFRFSFGRPNTQLPIDRSDVLEAATRARDELKAIRQALRSGKAWKAALTRARNP